MSEQQLGVFVSSRMSELREERHAIEAALEELRIDAWVYESDAGASPHPIRKTYLDQIEAADLYIGVFWLGYGRYTIDEYDHAQRIGKPCLIYEKRIDVDGRQPELQTFLDRISDVETGVTVRRFKHPGELQEFVKEDVAAWQRDIIRNRLAVDESRPALWSRPTPFIVPARNEEQTIGKTLSHVLADTRLGHSPILVVDDGSSDKTVQIVADLAVLHPGRVIPLTNRYPNQRKMGALRTAVEHLENEGDPAEFVVLLDADTRLDRVHVASMGGSLSVSTADPQWSFDVCAFRVLPTETNTLLKRLGGADYAVSTDAMRRLLDTVPCVSGAASLWRRATLHEVLREHTGVFAGDDLELTLLAHARTEAVVYDASILATTDVPRGVRAGLQQRLRWDVGLIRNIFRPRFWKDVFVSRTRVAAVFRMILIADVVTHPLKIVAFMIPFFLFWNHGNRSPLLLHNLVQVYPAVLVIVLAGSVLSSCLIRGSWPTRARFALLSLVYLGAPYITLLTWQLVTLAPNNDTSFAAQGEYLILSAPNEFWHFARFYFVPLIAALAAWWIPVTYLLLRRSSTETYRRFGVHTVLLPIYFLFHVLVVRTVAIITAPLPKRTPPVAFAFALTAGFLVAPTFFLMHRVSRIAIERDQHGTPLEWIIDNAQRPAASPDSSLVLYPSSYEGGPHMWMYDASLAAMALAVSDDTTSAHRVLRGLEGIQNSDGSWFTLYNVAHRWGPEPMDTLKEIVQNSWAVVAALQVRQVVGGTSFDTMVTRALTWLNGEIFTSTAGLAEPRPIQSRQSSVAYAAFRLAGNLLDEKWSDAAERIRRELLMPAWDEELGAFVDRPGTDQPGSFDAQTLSVMCLAPEGSVGADLSAALRFLEESYIATAHVPMQRGFLSIKGFAYSAEEPNNVLGEGALQVAAAYRALGLRRNATIWNGAAAQMRTRGGALAYAVGADFKAFANLPALAPTAWWILNEHGFNPLAVSN